MPNISFHSWEDKKVHAFRNTISQNVNVITQLEFELAYYNDAVQHVNHYVMLIPSPS